MSSAREKLILRLYELNAIKFGNFVLKSGICSPIYVDLRVLVSYPDLLSTVADLLWELICDNAEYDLLCGVPYTALPFATCMSMKYLKPMVMRRKEAKSYGTKQLIEGHFNRDQRVVIVEDVITSGASILETIKDLKDAGLVVDTAVVLLDRQQGGIENLAAVGLRVHRVLTLKDALDVLQKNDKVSQEKYNEVSNWISNNHCNLPKVPSNDEVSKLSISARIDMCKNLLTKRLLNIIKNKRTNLCVAVDVTSSKELLAIADELGPFVVAVKIHVDILTDFSIEDTLKNLVSLSKAHDFVIFEDRKFADIGNTVKLQANGLYKIGEWADMVTVHAVAGSGVLQGLKAGFEDPNKGCLLIAQMSSSENLIDEKYTKSVARMAEQHADFVVGFISQTRVSENPGFLTFTPGVNIIAKGDDLGQCYNSPQDVVNNGTDIVIVGRGILNSEDRAATAKLYRDQGFRAYINLHPLDETF